MSDLIYWLWLSFVPGTGNARFMKLVERFGSPQKIWETDQSTLLKIIGIEELAKALKDPKYMKRAEEQLELANQTGVKIITIKHQEYPQMLKNIHNPPPVLFIKGTMDLTSVKAVAVVGSRRATPYGIEMARRISKELADRGIAVVSGMARGIDTSAHKGTLEAGGNTIAVLGCGVDIAYPAENRGLIAKVAKTGAIISEYPIGERPFPTYFPARNRIISGLSMGVVVIEAGEKSGSLITADFALEQGREVFAVPGNANSKQSCGANSLIKQGAKLVMSIEDIVEELGNYETVDLVKRMSEKPMLVDLSEDESLVFSVLGDQKMHVDIIASRTGLSVQKLNYIITILELKGIVEQFPGKIFSKA